jgi:hypothetical protein
MKRNPIRTAAAATAATLMAVAGAATAAQADGVGVPGGGHPFVTPGTIGEAMPLPALPSPEGACPFPVSIQDVYTNQKVRSYDNGSTKGTGQLITEITNVNTGNSITVNISGPGRTYTDTAGVVHYILTGASLTWVSPGKDRTESAPVGLYLRHGSVHVDSEGNLWSYTGSAENLCDALS